MINNNLFAKGVTWQPAVVTQVLFGTSRDRRSVLSGGFRFLMVLSLVMGLIGGAMAPWLAESSAVSGPDSSAAALALDGETSGALRPAMDFSSGPVPSTGPFAAPLLQQFTSGGHVLGFGPDAVYLATGSHALRVGFEGANVVTPQLTPSPWRGRVGEGVFPWAASPTPACGTASISLTKRTKGPLLRAPTTWLRALTRHRFACATTCLWRYRLTAAWRWRSTAGA